MISNEDECELKNLGLHLVFGYQTVFVMVWFAIALLHGLHAIPQWHSHLKVATIAMLFFLFLGIAATTIPNKHLTHSIAAHRRRRWALVHTVVCLVEYFPLWFVGSD